MREGRRAKKRPMTWRKNHPKIYIFFVTLHVFYRNTLEGIVICMVYPAKVSEVHSAPWQGGKSGYVQVCACIYVCALYVHRKKVSHHILSCCLGELILPPTALLLQ